MIALNPLHFTIPTVYFVRALCISAVCAATCTTPTLHYADIAQPTLLGTNVTPQIETIRLPYNVKAYLEDYSTSSRWAV